MLLGYHKTGSMCFDENTYDNFHTSDESSSNCCLMSMGTCQDNTQEQPQYCSNSSRELQFVGCQWCNLQPMAWHSNQIKSNQLWDAKGSFVWPFEDTGTATFSAPALSRRLRSKECLVTLFLLCSQFLAKKRDRF